MSSDGIGNVGRNTGTSSVYKPNPVQSTKNDGPINELKKKLGAVGVGSDTTDNLISSITKVIDKKTIEDSDVIKLQDEKISVTVYGENGKPLHNIIFKAINQQDGYQIAETILDTIHQFINLFK
jgi:hypothetical protein